MNNYRKWIATFIALLLLLSCTMITTVFAEEKEHINANDINLTDEERILVEKSVTEPVTVGIIPEFFPISVYDSESKEFSGIIFEMMKLVSEHTGLVFDYKQIQLEDGAPVTWLKCNKTKIVAGILKTEKFMNDKELVLSDDLFDGSIAFVGRKGNNFIEDGKTKTIAIINGFQVALEYVEENFPDHKILLCKTTDECLAAVARGDADATLHHKYGLNYLLQNPHYENLEMIQAFNVSMSHCIAGRSADSKVLMSIIDKGVRAISNEEYDYVLINYTIGNSYEMTTADIVYKYRVPFAIIAILLLVIFSGTIAIAINRQRNAMKLKIAYGQVKEALALAEHASEAKGQFTSRMSHEIRTPLNAVMGYMTMAKNTVENQAKVYDYISKAEVAAKHLLAIINDVLDMSSIESGKLKIANSEFDLKQLISIETTIFYAQAKQKEILFEVLLTDIKDEKLIGDGLRVNQILMNLLSNAIKFTPKGGNVSLIAEQLITKSNKAYMRFTVTDTGIGMSDDFMKVLFTAYEQENAAIAKNYGGSGLGLAITKNLVTMMGGTIHAESEKGKGSSFIVELPFDISAKRAITEAEKDDFSNLRVLVADTDIGQCEYTSQLLMCYGIKTKIAKSGSELISELASASEKNDTYDLCIVDTSLTDIPVAEVIRQIHSIEMGEMPVVVATTYDFSEISDELINIGVDHIISKPIFQSTIFNLLLSIYGKNAQKNLDDMTVYSFEKKRLLLIEDNEMNREIATDILTNVGFSVDWAEDGKQGVKKFIDSEAKYYDGILMDIQMPEMNGYEATQAIRISGHPEAKNIPIIAMTANAFAEDVSIALAVGMNDHVSKPIDTDQLCSILKKHIGGIIK